MWNTAPPAEPKQEGRRLDGGTGHAPGAGIAIDLRGVSKTFHARGAELTAIQRLDLSIEQGEFFSLLGPSGCGKTTTLRVIAGFEDPTEGKVLLYGSDVTDLPPNHRDVNLVFQSYALFPHMNVFDNIAFGLRRRKLPKRDIAKRVGEMLALVELTGYEKRRPSELSGGQQQRVALARALVNHPRALLLDEPLAALDLKLRQAMQLELKRIQREVGITFVYVTHDQNEALTMSDRLAVMNDGRIEQLGCGRDIYERPNTRFVASFIGTSNLFGAAVARQLDGQALFEFGPDQEVVVPLSWPVRRGDDLEVSVRPEKISLSADRPDRPCRLRGVVSEVAYLGTSTTYTVQTATGSELVVFQQNDSSSTSPFGRGDVVWLAWEPEHSLAIKEPARMEHSLREEEEEGDVPAAE
jgi:spermidine/putrescine transport system ATP-binding protein